MPGNSYLHRQVAERCPSAGDRLGIVRVDVVHALQRCLGASPGEDAVLLTLRSIAPLRDPFRVLEEAFEHLRYQHCLPAGQREPV